MASLYYTMPNEVGTGLIWSTLYIQAGLIIILSPLSAAGRISQETEQRTIAALLNSPLSRSKIVLGKLLGAWTLILWLGMMVDLAMNNLETPEKLYLKIIGVAIAIFLIGTGTAIYVGAGISTGPRDGIMVGLEQRGLKIGIARTIIELFALSSGWLMGGTIGYASPFMAFLIGPTVQIILPYVDFRKK